jgi:hypothetical protein
MMTMMDLISAWFGRRMSGQGPSTMLWIFIGLIIAAAVIMIILILQANWTKWEPIPYFP